MTVTHATVPAPQRIQLVREGEDQVVMRAGDEPRTLALQPLLGGERLALRAAALVARVIEGALDVAFRTAAHVTTEIRRAAVGDPVGGAVHVGGQPMLLRIRLKMRLEYPAQRTFHVLRNARRAFSSTSPLDVALAPPAEPGSCNVSVQRRALVARPLERLVRSRPFTNLISTRQPTASAYLCKVVSEGKCLVEPDSNRATAD